MSESTTSQPAAHREAVVWVTLLLESSEADPIARLRELANSARENVALLVKLKQAGWQIEDRSSDRGYLDVVAVKPFAAADAALAEARSLGARNRTLDFGDDDYIVE